MSELSDRFEGSGMSASDFVSLSVLQFRILLQPDFSVFAQLRYLQKYHDFMVTHKLELHASFHAILNPSSGLNYSGGSDESLKDTTYSPGATLSSDKSSESPSKKAKNSHRGRQQSSSNQKPSSSESEAGSQNTPRLGMQSSGNCTNIVVSSDDSSLSDYSTSEDDSQTGAERSTPLVNRSQLGQTRRVARAADALVNDLDLKTLWKTKPLCKAVPASYKQHRKLNEDDRRILCKTLLSWLLKKTDYRPKYSHYQALTEKLLVIFLSEKASMWFLPPKTEGSSQRCPKGKWADKGKNMINKLRKKGLLKPSSRKTNNDKSLHKPNHVSVTLTSEEYASKQWFKRNNSEFTDVRKHWSNCRNPRLKEMILTETMTPAVYNATWNGALKLPDAYHLVLDDFDSLPEVFPQKYSSLKNKLELLEQWPIFSEKVIGIMTLCGLTAKEVENWKSALATAKNENARDCIILQLLPSLCKLKCQVKVGKKLRKPSAVESQKAFFLHVPVAGVLEEWRRERRNRYAELSAPLQPYIAVVASNNEDVTASYVMVDDISWKTSSVLQAVDICFKTLFSLNCNYNPEAKHLWLLIQHALYGIKLDEDHHLTSVTDFIGKLQ